MENEDFTLDFMGYKAMCHCRPIIQREHNMREPKIVSSEEHIDLLRPHETILDCGSLEKCYEQIFDEAKKKYNAKQKRKDRRIENYLETILNDKRQGKHKNIKADGSRKPAYEMIIQLGNRDNRPDDEKASKVLKDFCNFLIEKYPNIVPIGIYLHNDEFSIDEETCQKGFSPVHIHFDYVYVAHLGKSLKTGMELQCSMSGALSEMGFVTAKGKGTAQQQFEEVVRHDLQDFAEERGIKIDRTSGEKHSHKEKPVFQQMKENEKVSKNLELEQNELERDKSLFKTSVQKVRAYNQICGEVERNSMTVDAEISTFKTNRSEPFTTRFNKFVVNVKKIVTAITTELNWYKAAFKDFWSKTSKDFRHLADVMDRNNCENFSDYNKKFYKGELDYQIQQQLTIRQKKINDDYEWDR